MTPLLAFFSALSAMSENDIYYSNSAPNLVDLSAWRIVSIVATKGMDINGNVVPTFQMLYQELKKKKNTIYQFPRPDWSNNATVAALYAWYQTNVPNMQLTLYTSLVCIDLINVQNPQVIGGVLGYSDVIINDTMVMRREYNPNFVLPNVDPENPVVTPVTNIWVYQGNENDYKIYSVLGDQTIAGNQYNYYYNTYGGFY